MLSSCEEPDSRDAWHRTVTSAPPAETRSVQVSFSRSPDDMVSEWLGHADDLPSSMLVVAPLRWRGVGTAVFSDDRIETDFASPGGLTRLSALLRREFEEMPEGAHPVLRFEDLETVLEETDTESLSNLVDVVCGMSRLHGVEACYHLDPDGVDEERIAEIEDAFEEVVRGDGSDVVERDEEGADE